jgi:hypothetical protein
MAITKEVREAIETAKAELSKEVHELRDRINNFEVE